MLETDILNKSSQINLGVLRGASTRVKVTIYLLAQMPFYTVYPCLKELA